MQNIGALTIKQLLQNPTGKFSAYMARRDKIIKDLDDRYRLLMSKVQKVNFKIYKVKKDYLFHFQIPSEEFPNNLYYDVCVLFCWENEVKDDKTISEYKLKLFSNSPNFMFTYTYALEQNDMIIPFLKSKCSRLALTQAPTIRNPIEVYGFEKSIYFACRYIMDNNLTTIFDLDNNRHVYSETKLKSVIMTQQNKYEENKNIKKQIAAGKKTAKQASKTKPMTNSKTVSTFKKQKTSAVSKSKGVKIIKRKK